MTDLTTYLEAKIQEWWADGTAFPAAPSNVYVALHTGDPGNDASANEVAAGDYSRAETAAADWSVTGSGPTHVENANEIQFSTATSDWGTISHVSLWDASTGGNALWQGELDTSRTVNTDDRLVFPVGDFDVDLD